MVFQPGQSGNPRGRARGFQPLYTRKVKLLDAAESSKVDPLVFLASVVASERVDLSLRLQAAGLLSPYRASRCTSRNTPIPIDLPVAATIAQATANISQIGTLAAAGKIPLDVANDLVGYQRAFVESLATNEMEAKVAALEEALRSQQITPTVDISVAGGLPDLPGTNVTMPSRTLTARKDKTEPEPE